MMVLEEIKEISVPDYSKFKLKRSELLVLLTSGVISTNSDVDLRIVFKKED